MSVKLDERVVRCLGTLRSPQFEPLVDYLKALRADHLDTLSQANDPTILYRHQGRAECLKELIGNIENSDVLLTKLKR